MLLQNELDNHDIGLIRLLKPYRSFYLCLYFLAKSQKKPYFYVDLVIHHCIDLPFQLCLLASRASTSLVSHCRYTWSLIQKRKCYPYSHLRINQDGGDCKKIMTVNHC